VQAVAEDEIFHPVVGPVAEAEALYVRQMELPLRIQTEPRPFVVWDIGLGAAGNVLTFLRATRDLSCDLEIISFDRTLEPLRFAIEQADRLEYPQGYEKQLNQLCREHRSVISGISQNVTWRVCLGDFPTLIDTHQAHAWPKPNAIFFDPYSPAKNPAMWTQAVFTRLYELAAGKRAALATYSRSTMLRASLLLAGFFVGIGEATGEKEETTLAANAFELLAKPLDQAWLRRSRNSRSAQPLAGPAYCQAPLSPQTWQALSDHPQFRQAPAAASSALI